MKGYLRVFEDGDEIISKLYWGIIHENYLNFYKDKKSCDSLSIINLEECEISTIFSEKFNTDLIQIKTKHKRMFQLMPDNTKEFKNWESVILSKNANKPRSTNSAPRNFTNYHSEEVRDSRPETLPKQSHNKYANGPIFLEGARYQNQNAVDHLDILDNRERYLKKNDGHNRHSELMNKPTTSAIEVAEYRRRSSDNSNQRPLTPKLKSENKQISSMPRKHGNSDKIGHRGIETVKEDPMMSDNEILETKTLDEIRKKYPISDKTKRWSIAATDIVGKSNDELFIMLIQLNREKSHMDIWKEHLDKEISEIDDTLQNDFTEDRKREELENRRVYLINQLNEMEYMINLAHPLLSFLESIVQMSDVYKGDNHAFHVVYHQQSPSGKEDFSNIEFIRHNQEKEVAKLINENNTQSSSQNIQFNSFRKSLLSDSYYGKENDPEVALNLNISKKFMDRKNELNEVLEIIESKLLELDPLKTSVEKFLENCYSDKIDGSNNNVISGGSASSTMKSIKLKNISDGKTDNLSLMPRRSTRKDLKSDMIIPLNRSGNMTRHKSLVPQTSNRDSNYGDNSIKQNNSKNTRKNFSSTRDDEVLSLRNSDDRYDLSIRPQHYHSSVSLNERKYYTKDENLDDQRGYNTGSRLQNQLRELINGNSNSPIRKEKSMMQTDAVDLEEGPLIKLSANRYRGRHRPNEIGHTETHYTEDFILSPSNSDVSVSSALINQRMNLNEFYDEKKMWKNPGKSYNAHQVFDNSIIETIHPLKRADEFIDSLLASPPKLEIKDRYRDSISEDYNYDKDKSDRIRKQVAKESLSGYTESEVGYKNERESMLLKKSILAQEASKKSRLLSKT